MKMTTIEEETEGATIDTLATLLNQANTQRKNDQINNEKLLSNIAVAISPNDENSLFGSIQSLQSLNCEKFDQMRNQFQSFAKDMAENNTKAFIKALEEVIIDFNKNLTEQFGENFKELNKAVEKLVIWQNQHKEHVILIDNEFKEIKIATKETEISLSNIAKNASDFSNISKEMKVQNNELNILLKELSGGLSGIKQLGDEASKSMPIIKDNISELTGDFSKLIKEVITSSIQNYEDQQRKVSEQITNVHNNFDKIGVKIEKQMDDNASRIAQQVEVLDKQLEEELNKALQSLGTQLGSLSNKFVDDYSKLANVLRVIVKSSTESLP